MQQRRAADREASKEATYFALFALLEFIVQVPVVESKKQKIDRSPDLKLSKIGYGHLIDCLTSTGLLE